MEQGTDEWRMARVGKVTASRVADVIAKTKTGYSASRATYMDELLVERVTGLPTDVYVTPAMAWGTMQEKNARQVYEGLSGILVETTGFVPHPIIANCGASPDGLVADDGLIEIKCPQTKTHLGTILSKKIPDQYIAQMQWQMACTGRTWCDFISYDPRVPPNMSFFMGRLERDKAMIETMEEEIKKFLNELDEKIEALNMIGDEYGF